MIDTPILLAAGLTVAVLLLGLLALRRVRRSTRPQTAPAPVPAPAADLPATPPAEPEGEVEPELELVPATTPPPIPIASAPSAATQAASAIPSRPQPTGYAALSRAYAEEGRGADAALAQWAADLNAVGPLLAGKEQLFVTAHAGLGATDPRSAIGVGRALATELAAGDDVAAFFSPLDHLQPAPIPPAPEERTQHGVTVLLDRAQERMATAAELADTDLGAAHEHAREADLASFEALLLESALTHGDVDLVSLRLRLDLARLDLARLALETDGDDESAPYVGVERTREVLRGIVGSHELDALEAAFIDPPAGIAAR